MTTIKQMRKALYTRNAKHKAQINQVHMTKSKALWDKEPVTSLLMMKKGSYFGQQWPLARLY